jgi:hypothetical protein
MSTLQVRQIYRRAAQDVVEGEEARLAWAAWEEKGGDLTAAREALATTPSSPALLMAQGELETRQGDLEGALVFFMAAQSASSAVSSPSISKVTVKVANFLVHRLKDDSEALNVIEVGLAEHELSYDLYDIKLKLVEKSCNIVDILNVCDEAVENMVSATDKEYFMNQKSIFHDIYGGDLESSASIKNKIIEFSLEKTANVGIACNVCNIVFSTSYNLKRHMLSHEDVHSCPKCKKKFKSLVIFQGHKSKCKFMCAVCGKSYVRKCDFEKHIITSTHGQSV